jgi:hypothetical protein
VVSINSIDSNLVNTQLSRKTHPIVVASDAVVDPWTVVVHVLDAAIADRAVVRSCGALRAASAAIKARWGSRDPVDPSRNDLDQRWISIPNSQRSQHWFGLLHRDRNWGPTCMAPPLNERITVCLFAASLFFLLFVERVLVTGTVLSLLGANRHGSPLRNVSL